MKANVLIRFRDKETGKVYEIDSEYEASEKRLTELQQLGYVGEFEKPKKKKAKEGE